MRPPYNTVAFVPKNGQIWLKKYPFIRLAANDNLYCLEGIYTTYMLSLWDNLFLVNYEQTSQVILYCFKKENCKIYTFHFELLILDKSML